MLGTREYKEATDGRFKLLYDGACPICSHEVLWLYNRRPEAIEAVDTAADGFDAVAFGLTFDQVDAALYGIKPDGTITKGMDSLREGYRLGWPWLDHCLDCLVACSSRLRRLLPHLRSKSYAYRPPIGAAGRLR